MLLSWTNLWDVLVLFLIPVGGGIPAGLILAQNRHIQWPVMMILYFISDVILAIFFEPILVLMISIGKRSTRLTRVSEFFKAYLKKTTLLYGTQLGPFALVLISFGVDPMTGRAATVAAGHGFLSGWFLAILGDMFYFAIIMVSTLCLNQVLGNGTWTTIIITVLMIGGPMVVKRVRDRFRSAA